MISSLRQLGIYNEKNREKLNTLEIGAINIQLQRYSGLRVRAIDINSQVLLRHSILSPNMWQHPSIEELDFFELIPEGNYDLIVCSMVGGSLHLLILFLTLGRELCVDS